jgi:predicted DNA repair protein MutK
MSKVAAKKTAGVLGDDLALNAQQVAGVNAERELPVVWAVCKGSFINKLILVPASLLISVFLPWLITPLLMLGGAFLCFEGVEKLFHTFLHSADEDADHHAEQVEALNNPAVDMVAFEQNKIKGAVRTDFILSAEIIVIALGTVAEATLTKQVVVLSTIAIVITAGVYGLVAAIVKLDDGGLYLLQRQGDGTAKLARAVGAGILKLAPWLMKSLSVIGTAAMFLVGGGILVHGIPGSHDFIHHLEEMVASWPGIGVVLEWLMSSLINGIGGILAGVVVLALVTLVQRIAATTRSKSA